MAAPQHKRITGLDELQITGDGIYCIYPFSSLPLGKGCFKIGIATGSTFYARLESVYHTYYPMGFYYKNFLENPPIPAGTTKLKHYREIEGYILENVKARKVKCRARVNLEGKTEWVYSNQKSLEDIFRKALKKYGGTFHNYNLTPSVFKNNEGMQGAYFEGNIIFA